MKKTGLACLFLEMGHSIRLFAIGLLTGYEEIDLERAKTIPKHILKKWYREK